MFSQMICYFIEHLCRIRSPESKLDNRAIISSLILGGKSGLYRVECQVTPGGREPTESATENIPPICSTLEINLLLKVYVY